MKSRHFIVFYKCEAGDMGDLPIETLEGNYLNRAATVANVRDRLKKEVGVVVFTNIIELSSGDMEKWEEKED